MLLGKATRLHRYYLGLRKTYVATARLGWRSSTGDPDGELEHTGQMPGRLALPTGAVMQRPPMTSARKVGGERLYRKAHRGEVVERAAREVRIYRADLVQSDAERATFEIECSTGTYVRNLIETLGDAYCESLRRTAIGSFSIDAAGAQALGGDAALDFLPERRLTEPESERVRHGSAVSVEPDPGVSEGGRSALGEVGEETSDRHGSSDAAAVRLTYAGRVLAIARPRDDELKPEVVLA